MYRLLIIMLTIFSVSATQAYAEDTNFSALQQSIDSDVSQLRLEQGELSQFIEYRIKQKADKLHQNLQEIMGVAPLDTELLTPIIKEYIKSLKTIDGHFTASISSLKSQLGEGNDGEIMSQLANRNLQRDYILQAKLASLTWATTLSIDTGDMKSNFTASLIQRAELLDSLVHYTLDKLEGAVADASLAGTDVSNKQTVTQLNDRLNHSSASLGVTIELLDTLGQNTSEFKQTLFSTSGDITRDVVNLNVASSMVQQWFNTVKNQAIENGPSAVFKLFIFSLILLGSSFVGKGAEKLVKKTVGNSKLKFSKLLQDFFISLSGKTVFTVGLLIALSQLGFELGALLAGFGVAGLIIGFALQDTLSNFASGMMILIYRPYDVGDLINAAGVTGKVSHMSLVSTTIKTLDNQRLIIPNNKIWGDTINNITVEHQRRVDMTFGIGYSDDIEKAERVLIEIVQAHPLILKEPMPTVKLHTLGESSVDFVVRPWVSPEDYWDVYWDVTREVKMRFDKENISIPFPQRDVHIYHN